MTILPAANHGDILRYFSNATWTIGVMLFNDRAQCFTLEDAYRPDKIKGQTRIPQGVYELGLKPIGTSKFDNRDWNKPPLRYYGMMQVLNVPGFSDILIHPGNTSEDTEGCLLVGMAATMGSIQESVKAYMKIYPLIADTLKRGERVTITLKDKDQPAPSSLVA